MLIRFRWFRFFIVLLGRSLWTRSKVENFWTLLELERDLDSLILGFKSFKNLPGESSGVEVSSIEVDKIPKFLSLDLQITDPGRVKFLSELVLTLKQAEFFNSGRFLQNAVGSGFGLLKIFLHISTCFSAEAGANRLEQ
jgi:hypothetical protein